MFKPKRLLAAVLAVCMTACVVPTACVYAQSVDDYKLLSSNFNTDAVYNGPDAHAEFTLPQPIRLDVITIYHWNNGKGAKPGSISLYSSDTREPVGTFLAYGRNGNTYWDCYPDIVVGPGSYYVKDSDWDTASWNEGASGGMVELRGEWVDDADIGQYSTSKPQKQQSSEQQTTPQKYYCSDWAKGDINRAETLGLIPEALYGDDLRKPIIRGHFAAIAVKVYEYMSGDTLSAGSNPFNDSSDSYVLKAYNADIVAGTSANTFSPNSDLTREQAAAMLTRAYKKTVFEGWTLNNDYALEYNSSSRFSDYDDIRPYARDSVEYMAANGVITGMGNNMFVPAGTLTKEQAIAIAVRMADKLDTTPRTGQKPVEEEKEKPKTQTSDEDTEPVSPSEVKKVTMSTTELDEYKTSSFTPLQGIEADSDTSGHVILDKYDTVSFDVSDIPEDRRKNLIAMSVLDGDTPFYILPDPDALANGTYTYETSHYSGHILGEMSDEELMDIWCEKAAQQEVMRGVSEEELRKNLSEIIDDSLSEYGFGRNQYGGAIARYILSHDTKGEILTAAMDGDTGTLTAKIANGISDYAMDKILKDGSKDFITGEDSEANPFAKALGSNMGDNGKEAYDAVKEGKPEAYGKAILEMVKNYEKSVMPYVDKAEKFGKLVDKMGDIFADDMMEWTYEKYYAKWMNEEGQVDSGQWGIICEKMKGGLNRLNSKGVSDSDVKKYFEKRYKNEKTIQARKKDIRKFIKYCDEYNLLEDRIWMGDGKLKTRPTIAQKLNSIFRIREWLSEALKDKKGNYVKGPEFKDSDDNSFLAYMVSMFVECGSKNRGDFYNFLVENKIYTPQIAELAKPYLDEDKDKDKDKDTSGSDGKNTPFDPDLEITNVQSVSGKELEDVAKVYTSSDSGLETNDTQRN